MAKVCLLFEPVIIYDTRFAISEKTISFMPHFSHTLSKPNDNSLACVNLIGQIVQCIIRHTSTNSIPTVYAWSVKCVLNAISQKLASGNKHAVQQVSAHISH